MALITCSECGKQISSSATVCPNCGCETHFGKKKEEEKVNASKYIIMYGCALCFTLIGLLIWASTDEYEKNLFYHGIDITTTVAYAIMFFAVGIILYVIGAIVQKKSK